MPRTEPYTSKRIFFYGFFALLKKSIFKKDQRIATLEGELAEKAGKIAELESELTEEPKKGKR